MKEIEKVYPHVRLWSKDWGSVLYSGDEAGVEEFMRGHDWLYVTVDYRESWKERWVGRIEWHEGVLKGYWAYDYQKYIWPLDPMSV